MKMELTELKKHYRQAAAKIPHDSFYFEANNHKYRHSIDVLHAGQELLQDTPELANVSADFKIQAQRALLFHDIGRFEENIRRYESELAQHELSALSNTYDHGLIGYEILQNSPPYNDLRILFAVRYHGKMMSEVKQSPMWHEIEKLPPEQADEIKKILYLVRDADKLANLRVQKAQHHLRQDAFYKQLSPEAVIGPFSALPKEQFFAEQTVDYTNLKTYADRVLMVLSWIYDFNYRRTKQLFFEHQYDAYLLGELQTCKITPSDFKAVQNILENFHQNITV
ncbi:MAG: HD domain-containing protein [Alphaproteobacteria bacterium]|nr:HD domain-containing protein [Alphaproteobacteria bacterium]